MIKGYSLIWATLTSVSDTLKYLTIVLKNLLNYLQLR